MTTDKGDLTDEIAKIAHESTSWYRRMAVLVADLNQKLKDIIILLRRPRLYELS
jgi:hypothetical protein